MTNDGRGSDCEHARDREYGPDREYGRDRAYDEADLERRLRAALRDEAERITPADRRAAVLAMARETPPVRRHSGWLAPAASAAAVAVIAASVWGFTHQGGGATPAAATSRTSASAPASSGGPNGPSAAGNPSSGSAASVVPNATVAVAAYYVGAVGGDASGGRYGLYREWVRASLPSHATAAQKVEAALVAALDVQPLTNYEPYLQPWSGTRVTAVTVTDAQIAITLSNRGPSGFTAAQTRLAVQELVWTAQGAVGRGAVPVRFSIADGSAALFGTYPTSRTYNRPPADQEYLDLAPIWVESPTRGQVLPAAKPVVAQGQASVFEATVSWKLMRGSAQVKAGHVMASVGAPGRGTWQVTLGQLPAGSYTFVAYEVSQKDGQGVVAQTSKPFTVG